MKDDVAVTGTVSVSFMVQLPAQHAEEKVCCESPAVEAVLCAIQGGDIYMWGEDKRPAQVFFDLVEEDVELDESLEPTEEGA